MNTKKSNSFFLIISVITFLSIFFTSCNKSIKEGTIVFTQVVGNLPVINSADGNSWRFIKHSRIVALNSDESKVKLQILTNNYFSACSPVISYDGKSMVFAAQKNQNDIWQIYIMNLETLKTNQVTTSTENCIDPAFLPNGRLVFSKFISNNKLKSAYALFSCNLDGSEISQITYNPHAYFATTVLKDGRILSISKQLYPNPKDGMFMVLRPDGTKEELFYKGLNKSSIRSRGWETNNGKVLFIESDIANTGGGNIISINYNRPLHSKVNLTSGIKGNFYSIYPFYKNSLLVSYRPSNDKRYALYEFDLENKTLGKNIYKDINYNMLEVVVVKKQKRPKNLPSEINLSVKTGLLLCQDVNFTDLKTNKKSLSTSKAVKIEVLGINKFLGTVDVENDGSFYLKILANTPFRLQTKNKEGQIIKGPSSWMYLRPNERRGCVGCHADNEQTPLNRQPLSVTKSPKLIPAIIKN